MKINIVLMIALLSTLMVAAQQESLEKVESKYFKNLYQLNDSIYRSEQPSRKGFQELEQKDFKTILNLRRLKDDNRKARDTQLTLEHIRLKSKEIDEQDIIDVLRTIKEAKKPLLIHCWHGSDRTGVMSAAYRIVFENWSKEEAIKELRTPALGYHEKWYPHLVSLLDSLDVEKIRNELNQ